MALARSDDPAENPTGIGGPIEILIQRILGLVKDTTTRALRSMIADHARTAEAMSVAVFHKAGGRLPEPPTPNGRVNPYAVPGP